MHARVPPAEVRCSCTSCVPFKRVFESTTSTGARLTKNVTGMRSDQPPEFFRWIPASAGYQWAKGERSTMGTREQLIIDRVRAGDIDAFGEIVRRHQNDIYRIVAYAMRDRAASEDMIQQAFINAYTHLDRFRPGEDFGAWLRAIARSLVRNELRRSDREARRLRRYHNWLAAQLETDQRAETAEERLRTDLEKCREGLSEAAAEALSMRYERSMGFEDMARALGRTVEATRQMLTRIRVTLRQCMDGRRSRA